MKERDQLEKHHRHQHRLQVNVAKCDEINDQLRNNNINNASNNRHHDNRTANNTNLDDTHKAAYS